VTSFAVVIVIIAECVCDVNGALIGGLYRQYIRKFSLWVSRTAMLKYATSTARRPLATLLLFRYCHQL